MRVLLDCDEVLGEFAQEAVRFCNLYAREPGADLWTFDDIADFDIFESLGLEHMENRFVQHLIDTEYCLNMPVLPGAIEFVERLYQLDHEVVIVTSPHRGVPKWCHERTAWLWRHFSIQREDIIFTSKKDRVFGDVLVDDKPQNLVGFRERGILFDQPWNRDVRGAYRAESYQDVVARLRWIDA